MLRHSEIDDLPYGGPQFIHERYGGRAPARCLYTIEPPEQSIHTSRPPLSERTDRLTENCPNYGVSLVETDVAVGAGVTNFANFAS